MEPGAHDSTSTAFHREELPGGSRPAAARSPRAAPPACGASRFACRRARLHLRPRDGALDGRRGRRGRRHGDRDRARRLAGPRRTSSRRAPGLLYGGRVRCLRGERDALARGSRALRACYTGRPLYDPSALALRDRRRAARRRRASSRSTTTARSWRTSCAPPATCSCATCSRADEVAALRRRVARRCAARRCPGDKLSWWGQNADGEEVLCRVTRASAKPHLRDAARTSRACSRSSALADEPLVHRQRARARASP